MDSLSSLTPSEAVTAALPLILLQVTDQLMPMTLKGLGDSNPILKFYNNALVSLSSDSSR